MFIKKETHYFDKRHISVAEYELRRIEKEKDVKIKIIDALNPERSVIVNFEEIKNKTLMYVHPISGCHLRWKKITKELIKEYLPVKRYWVLTF